MLLHKTELARELLASIGPQLTRQERQVLIICNGERSLEQVVEMMGVESLALIQGLLSKGLLLQGAKPATSRAPLLGKLLGGAQALREATVRAMPQARAATGAPAPLQPVTPTADAVPVQSHTAQAATAQAAMPETAATPPVSAAPATVAATPAAPRRSMAATKMYIIDMLQLQRCVEASTIAADIQAAANEDEMIGHVLVAVRYLRDRLRPSMCARITERLLATIPELHLGRLEAGIALLIPTAPSEQDDANVVSMLNRLPSAVWA